MLLLISFLIIIISLPLTSFFLRSKSISLLDVSLSFYLGMGIITNVMFVFFVLLKVPFTSWSVLAGMMTVLSVGLLLDRGKSYKSLLTTLTSIWQRKLSFISIAHLKELSLLLFALLPVLVSLFSNLYWPIRDWDAITLYDYRAKVISYSHNLDELINQDSNYYFAYPLFTSLSHTVYYFLGVQNAQPFYSLISLFFLLAIWSFLKQEYKSSVASMFVAVIAYSVPIFNHSLLAYANYAYTAFLVLGLLFVSTWVKSKKWHHLLLAGLLLGLSLWTRDAEPFWISALIVVILESIRTKKSISILIFSMPILLCVLPWHFYKELMLEIPVSPSVMSISDSIKGISLIYFLELLKYLYTYFLYPFALIHLTWILSVFIAIKDKQWNNWPLHLIIFLNYGLVIAGTIMLSLVYSKWRSVGGSLERMSLFFIPLVTVAMVHSVWPKKKI